MYLSVQWTVSSDKSSVDIASSVLTPVNQSHRHVFEPGKTFGRGFFYGVILLNLQTFNRPGFSVH